MIVDSRLQDIRLGLTIILMWSSLPIWIFRIPDMRSTCEIITEFIKEFEDEYTVSVETARRLYRGILTDTMSFKTNNTTSNSLRMAAFLVDQQINIPELNADIYNIDFRDYKFVTYLRSKIEFSEGLA